MKTNHLHIINFFLKIFCGIVAHVSWFDKTYWSWRQYYQTLWHNGSATLYLFAIIVNIWQHHHAGLCQKWCNNFECDNILKWYTDWGNGCRTRKTLNHAALAKNSVWILPTPRRGKITRSGPTQGSCWWYDELKTMTEFAEICVANTKKWVQWWREAGTRLREGERAQRRRIEPMHWKSRQNTPRTAQLWRAASRWRRDLARPLRALRRRRRSRWRAAPYLALFHYFTFVCDAFWQG